MVYSTLIIILDSNEYINFFNKKNNIDEILSNNKISIFINELIIKEVLENIKKTDKFYSLTFKSNIIFFTEKLPHTLLVKYRNLGLKKGDIAIAALCEYINVDYFISENRDFLKSKKFGFKILNLKEFLKILR